MCEVFHAEKCMQEVLFFSFQKCTTNQQKPYTNTKYLIIAVEKNYNHLKLVVRSSFSFMEIIRFAKICVHIGYGVKSLLAQTRNARVRR